MNIREFAAKNGVSRQAVYSKLKAAGIALTDVTQDGTGVLTADGQAVLERLYGSFSTRQDKSTDTLTTMVSTVYVEQIAALTAERDAMKQANEVMSAKIVGLEEINRDLQQERDYLRSALEREQDISTRLALLQAPPEHSQSETAAPRRLTWRERLTGKVK